MGRLRIIAALADPDSAPLTKYQLERRTGLRSRSLSSDIRALMDLGWVVEVNQSERRRLYELSTRDATVSKLLDFLGAVGYIRTGR